MIYNAVKGTLAAVVRDGQCRRQWHLRHWQHTRLPRLTELQNFSLQATPAPLATCVKMGARLSSIFSSRAPKICKRHEQPFLNVRCGACAVAGSPVSLCTARIREHTAAHPTHGLAPFTIDASFLRESLVALVGGPTVTGATITTPATSETPASSYSGGLNIEPVSTASPGPPAKCSPIIECARLRVLAAQAGLDALATNEEAALVQLETNRDAALSVLHAGVLADVEPAEVLAIHAAGVDAVHAAAASKRSALETELVAADAALSEVIDAVASLSEVRL